MSAVWVYEGLTPNTQMPFRQPVTMQLSAESKVNMGFRAIRCAQGCIFHQAGRCLLTPHDSKRLDCCKKKSKRPDGMC